MNKKINDNRGKRIQTTLSKELMKKIDKILSEFYIFTYRTKSDLVRHAVEYYINNIVAIEKEELIEQFEYLESEGMTEGKSFYVYMKGVINRMNET